MNVSLEKEITLGELGIREAVFLFLFFIFFFILATLKILFTRVLRGHR